MPLASPAFAGIDAEKIISPRLGPTSYPRIISRCFVFKVADLPITGKSGRDSRALDSTECSCSLRHASLDTRDVSARSISPLPKRLICSRKMNNGQLTRVSCVPSVLAIKLLHRCIGESTRVQESNVDHSQSDGRCGVRMRASPRGRAHRGLADNLFDQSVHGDTFGYRCTKTPGRASPEANPGFRSPTTPIFENRGDDHALETK
jgi:hypothetical protein